MTYQQGIILRTKSGSKAEVTFTDMSVLRLSENTRIEIKDYGFGPGGRRSDSALFLDRGKIRVLLSKSGEGSLVISTPNASGTVKGTDIIAIYQRSSTSIAALSGKVSVSGASSSGEPVELITGQTSVISGDTAPTAPGRFFPWKLRRRSRYRESKGSVTAEKPAEVKMTARVQRPESMKAVVTKVAGGVRVKSRGSITWHDAKERTRSLSRVNSIKPKIKERLK
jgi:hypothetical protein